MSKTASGRWTRESNETSCYKLEWEEHEMCQKCREFSERMRGLDKKPRKGTKPKCERIKLMKNEPKEGRLQLHEEHFKDVLQTKGCTINQKKTNLDLSTLYSRDNPRTVSSRPK